jgi:flagellar hook-associated protein 2
MADPIGTFSGLASGIQWRDMVDQIIALESKRTVDPLTKRQNSLTSASSAWTEFQGVVARFRDAAQAVRDAKTFNTFSASATTSPTTNRELVTVSTDSTAAPGTYSLEVQQVATAEKLSGAVATTATTALGVTGSFAVNGRAVSVIATDTLTTLRDKVNALNAGSTATGVSASILRSSTGVRLVFSADQTGSTGIELVDDSASTLQTLGFIDTTVSSNITASGDTQTYRLSSATATLATLLGISLPTPSTIKVGGQVISVDLAVDSLATVAARINAASGLADAAEVVTETVGGRSYSRLQTRLAVEADAADAANSAANLAALGFTKAGRGGIAQVVKSANTFTDNGNGSANAATGTLLSDLQVSGQSLGIANGDVISVTGKRGDGTSVTRTLAVGVGSTLQDLLSSANDATSGFGAGTRTATMSVSGGQLTLTDGSTGDSQLGVSITVAKSGGGTISLGNFGSGNGGSVGRSRLISAGADARFKLDDQIITRSSNLVTDVVTGVTLNLKAAEAGTTVDVTVKRNLDDAVARMQQFASAYNDVRSWQDANVGPGKRLAGSSALKSMVNSLSSSLLTPVIGLTGSLTTSAMAGVSRDKTGVLSVNADTLKAALTSSFEDVRKLFSQAGVPSDPEVAWVGASDKTKATATGYAVTITRAATAASATGAVLATYVTAGTPDTMSITDSATGKTGSVTLTNGDSIDKVIANLNSAFTTQRMNLVASNVGGAVKILASDFGTTGGFTVAYTPGSADGTAQLGIAAGSFVGLDVAGTINGVAATGKGQQLTSATGVDTEGMQLKYTGTSARAAGTVAYSVGVGGMLYNVAADIARDLNGQAVTLSNNAGTQADAISSRITDATDRLARRRSQLIAQFIAMESAMSRAQALSSSLNSTINSLSSNSKN